MRKKARASRNGEKKHDDAFPMIAQWVLDGGWIEIGELEGTGFVARALDHGGLCFEDDGCTNLDEAMQSLERGIRAWMKEQGIE